MTALLSRVLYNIYSGNHIFVVQSTKGYSNPPSSPFLRVGCILPLFLFTTLSVGSQYAARTRAAKEREPPDLRARKEGEREVVKKKPWKQNNPNQTSTLITGQLFESLLSLAYLPALVSRAMRGERHLLPLRGRERCAGTPARPGS